MIKTKSCHYFRDCRAFSFIEMLLVLVIIGVVSTIILHFSFARMTHYTYLKTVNQIESAMRAAQTMAMAEQMVIYCEVELGRDFVIKKGPFEKPTYVYQIPEGMNIRISTKRGRIQFLPSGNVMEIGKIIFTIDGERVTYTINLGKGRFLLYE